MVNSNPGDSIYYYFSRKYDKMRLVFQNDEWSAVRITLQCNSWSSLYLTWITLYLYVRAGVSLTYHLNPKSVVSLYLGIIHCCFLLIDNFLEHKRINISYNERHVVKSSQKLFSANARHFTSESIKTLEVWRDAITSRPLIVFTCLHSLFASTSQPLDTLCGTCTERRF